MGRLFIYFLMMLALTSCHRRLTVQLGYVDREFLASYHVNTPDPYLRHPKIGQRLLITWTISKEDLASENLHLHLKVRFRNHKEQEVFVPIHSRRGFYVYKHMDTEYCQTGGILTYRIELINNDCLLETWSHPLWKELIKFEEPAPE